MTKIVDQPIIRDADEACRALEADTEIGLDLETNSLHPITGKIAVISMRGRESGARVVLHVRGSVPERVRQFIGRKNGPVFVTHNGMSFDIPYLAMAGVDVFSARWYDTMTGELANLASQRRDVSVSLKATTQRRTGKKLKKEADHSGWMNPTLNDEQLTYAIEDVDFLSRIKQEQLDKVGGSSKERALQTEMDLIPVVVGMILTGLPISKPHLDYYIDEMHTDRVDGAQELGEILGPINLRSPIQLRQALAKAGVPVPSTKYEVVRQIELMGGRPGHICGCLLRWRHADQRIKMYTEEWTRKYVVDHGDYCRVHARFWPCGTDTGRFSSSEPNLQQVPVDMRWVYGHEPGMTVVSADYSQIEVRVAAELSGDEALLGVFRSGHGDVHSAIAADVFGVPVDQVTYEQRKLTKAMTFCLLFAGGANTLFEYAKMSGGSIDLPTAKALVGRFFRTYQGLSAFRDKACYMANSRRPATITLPTGLKRVIAGPYLTPMRLLNTSIQGSAAAGIKFAMLEARARGLTRSADRPWGLAAQVHDELVAVVPDDLADDYAVELEAAMIGGMKRVLKRCPVAVEVKKGKSWNDQLMTPARWAAAGYPGESSEEWIPTPESEEDGMRESGPKRRNGSLLMK
jgi:DNA polymerase-1